MSPDREKGDKAEQDATQEDEQVSGNAATAVSDNTASVASGSDTVKQAHGGRNFLLVLLLIVVAVVGALAATGKLAPLWQSFTASIQHDAAPQKPASNNAVAKQAEPAAVETTIKTAADQRPAASSPTSRTIQPQPVVQKLLPDEQVQTLLGQIKRLQGQLQQMSASQQALQNGLIEQQQMNLQVRLRWIADPASRLPQIQLAWEEISLLPGLTDEQRSEAVAMHKLARSRVQQLKQWQDALQKWADTLVTPVHRNVVPEPSHPWLAWIAGQFRLRRAPSIEARHLSALREQLLDASRRLTLESWPEKGAWQSLQAELLLQIKAMQRDRNPAQGSDGQAVDTGLPENFDAIHADLHTLRQTALAWQQGGAQ